MQITTTHPQGVTANTQELINIFLRDKDIRPSSRYRYSRTFRKWIGYLNAGNIDISDVRRSHVIDFKEHLKVQGYSSNTIGSYLTVVKSFYNWAEDNSYYPNIARGVRMPKRPDTHKKESLTLDEAGDLFNYAESLILRDRAIINLMIRTGIRVMEAHGANISDITTKGGKRVLMILGKGKDVKKPVVLTDTTYRILSDYLNAERKLAKSNEPLFVSKSKNSKGKRIGKRSISNIVKKALQSIGLDGKEYTAHCLRHTAACLLLVSGADLYKVQKTLRHEDPATTQIYLKSIEEKERLRNSGEEALDNIYKQVYNL